MRRTAFNAAIALLSGAALFTAACSKEQPEAELPAEPQAAVSAEPELDPISGLKMTGDWVLVRASCTACHSGKQITQQRGTADQWLSMIRWMQEKQKLWQFDPVTEGKIIAYLAENYPPNPAQRRAALPAALMPPNPYATVADTAP
jgi:hypothetical protein